MLLTLVLNVEKASSRIAVHTYVIRLLTCDTNEYISSSKVIVNGRMLEATQALSFRLCMANVLISACQKISDSGRKSYAQRILPPIINSFEVCSCELQPRRFLLLGAILPYCLSHSLKILKCL